MRIINYKNWRLLIRSDNSEVNARKLFDKILAKNYEISTKLKENHRSSVFRIAVNNNDLVLKVPLEKNKKSWIRFLTFFRQGEAFKNIYGMQKLLTHNIKTTKPILAAEKRKFGMVTDSWLVYDYLEGNSCLDRPEYFPQVIDTLHQIHASKLLHNDSQIRNFLIHNTEIYVIDANPKSIKFSGFEQAYEFVYLKRSQPEIEKHMGNLTHSFWYKFANNYIQFDRKLAAFRRALKRFLGFKKK